MSSLSNGWEVYEQEKTLADIDEEAIRSFIDSGLPAACKDFGDKREAQNTAQRLVHMTKKMRVIYDMDVPVKVHKRHTSVILERIDDNE